MSRPQTEPPRTGAPGSAAAPDGLMVFDGVCRFCSGWVRFVLATDRAAAIRFTPIQSAYGRMLCGEQGIDPDDPSTFLFFDRGRALGETDAIAALLARLPAPWRWLRVLAAVPRPIRDAAYRWVARNRYRLLGRRQTCLVPTPEIQARFVTEPPAC